MRIENKQARLKWLAFPFLLSCQKIPFDGIIKELQPAFTFRNGQRLEIYFRATISHTSAPMIQGEEALRSHAQNIYQPEWLDIEAICDLNLRPAGLKNLLLDCLTREGLKN